ncbi:putative protein OS=Tsukamurella paurometabola (strain ATCC 8368 / DSM / CCUG 35730 /CIP 100753 / JCM 10117 / KCTC 9821 / NBRC 16120 / NCIMB 702349/ NCTC 13040) OX=521096 GN=Tpau_3768 PE=4 SV=1 [Tsukamurella paurometabola]|uniref:Uncharacterized protein n=1 Tax=Tsukamurella paurometabola (strain ATCC 8368 / DSM 20162 / CCUG 35730 / CIP 100753 / JCM 10117 / KCTC 9821 / NBRC 16120 / NCIMB 702349 / NCTC 13040) TaxID=521096 RepID=D5UYP3_TSUPD|nr:hypothetical protein [Tsukamurella paurometabola]ADG80346.1 hypothetical protein Tpau_3768 [Tsukamurella paurometabola DSM 20162]SUP39317.1 Uncharacterised protein [Tsukamurella paurometabola]
MRRVISVLAAVVAVLGIGVVIPGVAGSASACSCVAQEAPPDLVVIRGVVQAQRVGYRDTDVQVRVTTMYGAPPEKVTVVRVQSGSYTSCGSSFRNAEEVALAVKREGPRWVNPVCANAVLRDSQGNPRDFAGVRPGANAPENPLPGAPQSWLFYLQQPVYLQYPVLVVAAGVACVLLVGLIVAARARR